MPRSPPSPAALTICHGTRSQDPPLLTLLPTLRTLCVAALPQVQRFGGSGGLYRHRQGRVHRRRGALGAALRRRFQPGQGGGEGRGGREGGRAARAGLRRRRRSGGQAGGVRQGGQGCSWASGALGGAWVPGAAAARPGLPASPPRQPAPTSHLSNTPARYCGLLFLLRGVRDRGGRKK